MPRKVWLWAGAGWLALVLLSGAFTLYLDDSNTPGSAPNRWERAPAPSDTPSRCPDPTTKAKDAPRSCSYWERG